MTAIVWSFFVSTAVFAQISSISLDRPPPSPTTEKEKARIALCSDDLSTSGGAPKSELSLAYEPAWKRLAAGKDPMRWLHFESFLRRFSSCIDDGSYAGFQGIWEDGASKDWDGFIAYATAVGERAPDPKILKTMTNFFSAESGDPDDIETIRVHAQKRCPATLKAFCKEVLSATAPGR